jgi:hypothetical protein
MKTLCHIKHRATEPGDEQIVITRGIIVANSSIAFYGHIANRLVVYQRIRNSMCVLWGSIAQGRACLVAK